VDRDRAGAYRKIQRAALALSSFCGWSRGLPAAGLTWRLVGQGFALVFCAWKRSESKTRQRLFPQSEAWPANSGNLADTGRAALPTCDESGLDVWGSSGARSH